MSDGIGRWLAVIRWYRLLVGTLIRLSSFTIVVGYTLLGELPHRHCHQLSPMIAVICRDITTHETYENRRLRYVISAFGWFGHIEREMAPLATLRRRLRTYRRDGCLRCRAIRHTLPLQKNVTGAIRAGIAYGGIMRL